MKLFLQVEVGLAQESGDLMPLVHFASSLSSDLIGTEIDNQSDSSVIDVVLKLIEQVDSVFLLFLINDSVAPPGGTSRILDHLARHPEYIVNAVIHGHHNQMEALLNRFTEKLTRVNNEKETMNLIRSFAQ